MGPTNKKDFDISKSIKSILENAKQAGAPIEVHFHGDITVYVGTEGDKKTKVTPIK